MEEKEICKIIVTSEHSALEIEKKAKKVMNMLKKVFLAKKNPVVKLGLIIK